MIPAVPQREPQPLSAPFPWFGGKSRAAAAVWDRFTDVDSYVEPFFGSGAVLLGRPDVNGYETINDADGFVANFWRAVSADPVAVATGALCPINEVDLTARHLWLNEHRAYVTARLMADPHFYDPVVASWWLWGICAWIGDGWCTPDDGPWCAWEGALTYDRKRLLPGAHVRKKRPELSRFRGIHRDNVDVEAWMVELAQRFARVRVCCGDWKRVVTDAAAQPRSWSKVGIFLDPPYASDRYAGLYAVDSGSVAYDVNAWCASAPAHWKICIAGLGDEHDNLGWERAEWRQQGGYGNLGSGLGRANSQREVLWFSPACS
jgi:DNA adenine methylase